MQTLYRRVICLARKSMNLAVQCPDISGINLSLAQFNHLIEGQVNEPGLAQRSGIRRFNLLVAQLDDLLDSKIGQSSFAKLDKVNWVNLVLTQLDNLLNVEVCYPCIAQCFEETRLNPVLTQLDDLLNPQAGQPCITQCFEEIGIDLVLTQLDDLIKSERRHSLSRCAPLELSDWFPPTFVLLPTLAGPPLRLGKRLLAKNFQQLIGLVYSDLTCDQHC